MASSGEGAASSSSCVYVHDDKHGWLPANVISNSDDGKTCEVHVVALKEDQEGLETTTTTETRNIKLAEYENNHLPLQNVDASGHLIPMADMCDLPSLHEAAILYNLQHRYEAKDGSGCKPYTRVGDIVIAVNPFQWLPDLYAQATRDKYVDQLVWNGEYS
jgi:myosin-5